MNAAQGYKWVQMVIRVRNSQLISAEKEIFCSSLVKYCFGIAAFEMPPKRYIKEPLEEPSSLSSDEVEIESLATKRILLCVECIRKDISARKSKRKRSSLPKFLLSLRRSTT